MGVSPREAAARRRRGVLARAAYAVRMARRDRAPPLPLAGTSQCGARPAAALASAGDPRRGARSSSPSTSSSRGATAPEPPKKLRPTLPAREPLLPSRRTLDAAERRAAFEFFNDLTKGGRVSLQNAVRSWPWNTEFHQRAASVVAFALELLPEDPRMEPVWVVGVGQIASAMLSDLSPEFYQVCLRNTGSGRSPFRSLPICGRWGWRRRARLAGLL